MVRRQRLSLKASKQGQKLIKEARIKKIEQARTERISTQGKIETSWDVDEILLQEVSMILEPEKNWDGAEIYAVSLSTWRRFREAKRITATYFQAFCQVLALNWEDIKENEADANRDLSEAPPLADFYGRNQDLAELQQWLIKKRCRLVLVHGRGGIGKSALARNLVNKISDQYDCLIWLSLESAPPFSEILIKLVQFLSKGEIAEGDISQIIQYLHQQRCLIVLDAWEEILGNQSEEYTTYNIFVERVAKESHKSCLLLLSRRKPKNIEILEGQFVCSKKLGALTYEETKEFLIAEGLSGTSNEIEEFSRRYNNPWILKRIVQSIHTVFDGDISPFMNISVFVDEPTTNFLNRQFQALSPAEINLIYWVAIRRNTALWHQLVQDSEQFLNYNDLFKTSDDLIARHSLLAKNTEEKPVIYILDPVILKYSTQRFIIENYQQISQLLEKEIIHGSELLITHNFITEYPKDEELNQEQMRRIVKPLQKMLLADLRSQVQLENQLQKILSLLADKGLSQGYAYQNVLHLTSACR